MAADKAGGALFIYDGDTIVDVNGAGQRLYPAVDWSRPVHFDTCFWSGFRTGLISDPVILSDPERHLAYAKTVRLRSSSFRFTRARKGVPFDRHHARLDGRWNAQLWLPIHNGRVADFTLSADTSSDEVTRHLSRGKALSRLMALIDGMGVCVAVLDADGRMVDCTPSMAALLGELGGLHLDADDVIACETVQATGKLRAAIAQVATGRSRATMVPVPVQGASPLQVGLLASTRDDPCAILAIAHSEDTGRFADILREAYGLTPTEADIAIQVGTGARIDDIVEASGRAHNTIRSQMESAKRKLGTDRQHSFAHLLTKAAAIVGGLKSGRP